MAAGGDGATADTPFTWLTAHLGFAGPICGAVPDRLLLELVTPLVRQLAAEQHIDRFFFLRYNVPDHHLRLRLGSVNSEAQQLAIEEAVGDAAAAHGLVHYLQWHDYEPEYGRYGGPRGVLAAEELFVDASRVALALMHKIPPGDRPSRLGKGILTSLVLLYVFTGERRGTSQLAEYYARAYVHSRLPDEATQQWVEKAFEEGFDRQAQRLAAFVEAAWEAMEDEEPLTPELDLYRQRMESHRDRLHGLCRDDGLLFDDEVVNQWPDCVWRLVPSYLHMMNNRLGIELEEEAYLARLIHLTLSPSIEPAEETAVQAPGSESSMGVSDS